MSFFFFLIGIKIVSCPILKCIRQKAYPFNIMYKWFSFFKRFIKLFCLTVVRDTKVIYIVLFIPCKHDTLILLWMRVKKHRSIFHPKSFFIYLKKKKKTPFVHNILMGKFFVQCTRALDETHFDIWSFKDFLHWFCC